MKPLSIPKSGDDVYHIPEITTFAILEGLRKDGRASDFYVIEGKKIQGISYFMSRTAPYDFLWASLENIICQADTHFRRIHSNSQYYGIRPTIEGEAFDLVKDEFINVKRNLFNKNGGYIAEFGEYIEDVVSYKIGVKIADAFEKGLINKTDKTFNSSVGPLQVFEYKRRKFVKYDAEDVKRFYDSIAYHEVYWFENNFVFLEVKPLRFIVDEEKRIAVCERVIQAGKDAAFNGKFEDSPLSEYLNGEFLRDILLPGSKMFKYVSQVQEEEANDTNIDINEIIKEIYENDDIDEILKEIYELLRGTPVENAIKSLIDRLIREYNDNLDKLKGNLNFQKEVKLSLNPSTKEELKFSLLSDLENILSTLKKQREDYKEYYHFLSVLDYKSANTNIRKSGLSKDIESILTILTSLDKSEEDLMINKLDDVIAKNRRNILSEMMNSISITDRDIKYECPQKLKTYSDLELDFRRVLHSYLLELNERVATHVCLDEFKNSIPKIIDGLYTEAKDTMINMYLNEINNIAIHIKELILRLPKDSQEGTTEKLLDILNAMPIDSLMTEEKMLAFLRKKIRLLHSLESEIEEHIDSLSGIESYKYKP